MLGVLALPVRAEEPVRIVALGDSLVHGYGLEQGDGFVPQLQAWLEMQGEAVTVINAGVSGDTSAGGQARLAWSLGDGADALIVVLGGNDLLRGFDPAATEANLDSLVAQARALGLPVLLAGMRAPGNYGAEYKARFDGLYARIAERHGALLYPYFLEGVDGDPTFWQDDAIHPNALGVDEIVARIGPLVRALIAQARAQTG